MDVQNRARTPDGASQEHRSPPGRAAALCGEQVGVALGAWQAAELRLARSFAECRGLGHEQLEDLYQETALVLLKRSFHSDEHLRHALRWGIKHRALHLHRDERRRGEILAQRAPELRLAAEGREASRTPELAALLEDDRLVVTEFLAELSALERHVFWLMAEGMRYRAIAPLLAVSVNQARKAARGCEAKRERFQLLYDTGRLCGFRSQTITAMQAGEAITNELAQRAYAHLDGCTHCRAQHKTNARRLRRSFQGQAAALLPVPILAGRLGRLAKLGMRMRALHQRLLPYSPPPPGGGIREGAVATLAGGGVAAKLAAGAATVAVLAGGTIGATHALQHAERRTSRPAKANRTPRATPPATRPAAGTVEPVEQAPADAAAEHARLKRSQRAQGRKSASAHEPGGFAYLGVPTRSASGAGEHTRADTASVDTAPATTSSSSSSSSGNAATGEGGEQRGGGPFSP
jgi:RNA polymerase sigma factor (sigma-70 family)